MRESKTKGRNKFWRGWLCLLFTVCLMALTAASAWAEVAPGHSGTSDYNEADGNKIESVKLIWNTPDTRDNGDPDDLWLSTRSTTPLSMKFTLQVDLSGQADAGDYGPGAIRIRIPMQIWHARDVAGEPGSTLEAGYGKMDLPIGIKPDPNVEWYYEIDGDDYVIINSKTVGATSNHTFECSIYDLDPVMIVDESISDILKVHVDALTSEGNTIWMDSNPLIAQIDTGVKITGVSKTGGFYEFVDDEDGVPPEIQALVPSGNPDDYVYVKWVTRASMGGNQYHDLKMTDPETWCYKQTQENGQTVYTKECQGYFLAEVDGAGRIKTKWGDEEEAGKGYISEDGRSYKNDYVYENEYRSYSPYCYLWTAYPNETFVTATNYYFRNADRYDLLEYDPEVDYWEGTDIQEPSYAEGRASVNFTKMEWEYPPGRFLAFKYIETSKTHKHPYPTSDGLSTSVHNKKHTYEMALNRILNGENVTMDYEVLTVGYGYMFTAGPLANEVSWIDINGREHSREISPDYDDQWDSEEWIQDPEHFCNWYYIMDTTDRWDFFQFINREGGDPQLTGEDYQFEGVYINAPEMFTYGRVKNKNYRFKEDTPFGHTPDNTLDKPEVEVWVEYNNGAAGTDMESGSMEGWEYVGTYKVENGSLYVPFENTEEHVVTGYRTRIKTNQAACKLTTHPQITLKCSERVHTVVEQLFAESSTPSTTFRNDDNLYVELFVNPEDDSIYDPETNPEGKVHPKQEMFVPEDTYLRQYINDDSAVATFTGAGYGIYLTKDVQFNPRSIDNGGDNDVYNKRAILHYTATCTEQSNLSNLDLYNEAVELGAVTQDTHGVWYDLLPEYMQPVLSTVRMTRSGDTVESVYAIENFRDTGRTMLVVECSLTPSPQYLTTSSTGLVGDRFGIRFDATIDWVDLNAMPANYQYMNYVAYESGIIEPTGIVGTLEELQGENDTIAPTPRMNRYTPTGVPADIVAAFLDLDPDTEDGRFVYARVPVTPNVNMDAHTEYVKYVKSDLDGIWTQGLDGQQQVNVYEGQNYTYRLRVSSGAETNTWDMVLYDSLENYLIPAPSGSQQDATKEKDYLDTQAKKNWDGDWKAGTNGAPGGQWRGRLVSVDVKDFIKRGCAPVLYYSTIPWMQFSDTAEGQIDESVIFDDTAGHYVLDDPDTWTRVESLNNGVWTVGEGVNVTAIAIDASRTSDGEKFVLGPKETISAYLHMIAPDDHGDENQWHAKGAYAHKTDAASTFEDIDWEAATNPENNMHAFNNTRLISRQANESDTSMTAFLTMIRNDYTRVGIMPQIKKVRKEWVDDDNHDNIRPDSIIVEMLRKTQGKSGDYQPVLNEITGEPVTITLTPETVTVENTDGTTTEKEVWEGVFYQVDVVDEEGNLYLYTFRDSVTGYTDTVTTDSDGVFVLRNTHKNETITIKGEKQWLMPDGAELSDAAKARMPESVKVILYRTGSQGEKEKVTEKTVTPDESGVWTYDFGKQEKYERGGFEYIYTVDEEETPGFIPSVMDPDELPEGYEFPFMGTVDYNPDELETFYNFYLPYGDVAMQKTILQATGVSREKEFTFTFELYNMVEDEKVEVGGTYDYDIYDVTTAADGTETLSASPVSSGLIGTGDTFTMKGGQRIVIRKLPAGVNYGFTEAAEAGWTQGNPVQGNGQVLTGKTVRADFTNTYSAEGVAQVAGSKKLTGRKLKSYAFSFELVDNNPDSETYGEVLRTTGNYAPEEGGTQQDAATGVITSIAGFRFGALTYDQADAGKTFHYILREMDTAKPGFEGGYDSTEYPVTVTVVDNGDGTLTCTADPADPIELQFENEYKADGELQLNGWKRLLKRDLADQEFTFALYKSNENGEALQEIERVKNDAAGNVNFTPIVFTQDMVSVDPEHPFVYYYLMKEVDTGDEEIIYSTYRHLFVVTPVDDGYGNISFDQQDYGFDDDEDTTGSENAVPVFINDVKDGSLKVSKSIQNGSTGTKFTFKIKLNGMKGGNFNLERETDNSQNGEGDATIYNDTPTPKDIFVMPANVTGVPYAALKYETKELVFFRTDADLPLDPWGNGIPSNASSDGTTSTDGSVTWFKLSDGTSSHPWTSSSYKDKIKTVWMRDPMRYGSTSHMFYLCSNLESVTLDKLDLRTAAGSTRNESWLYNTFSGTPNLKYLDLGYLDLTQTYDVQYAFKGCKSLETLNIGHLKRKGSSETSHIYQNQAFMNTSITCITIGDETTFSAQLPNPAWDDQYPWPGSTKQYQDQNYADRWVNISTNQELTSMALFTEGNHGGTWLLDPKYVDFRFDNNGGTGTMTTKTDVNVRQSFTTGHNFYKFGFDFAGFEDQFGNTFSAQDGLVTIPANTYTNRVPASGKLVVNLQAIWTPVSDDISTTSDTLTVQLYGGESITIKDIPAYTAYEVWEETPQGWVLVRRVDDSGKIQPNNESHAQFTNKYAPNMAFANITASKRLDGVLTGGFAFELYNADENFRPVGDPIQTKTTTDGGVATFDIITYEDETEVGKHYYVIKEVIPAEGEEGYDPNIVYDEHLSRITVEVSDDGRGSLSAVTGFHDEHGLFKNNTKPGSIKITKAVNADTYISKYRQFSFKLSFVDTQGNPVPVVLNGETMTSLSAVITTPPQDPNGQASTTTRSLTLQSESGSDIKNYVAFSLEGGQTLQIAKLPANIRYKVEELDVPEAWTQDDKTNDTGVIVSQEETEVSFTNSYTASGKLRLQVQKQIEDETPELNAYRFELYQVAYSPDFSSADPDTTEWDPSWDFEANCPTDGAAPMDTAANTYVDDRETIQRFPMSDGEQYAMPNPECGASMARFLPMDIGKEGIYLFAIREMKGDDDTMEYTDDVLYAQVLMLDPGGHGKLENVLTYYWRYNAQTQANEPVGYYAYLNYYDTTTTGGTPNYDQVPPIINPALVYQLTRYSDSTGLSYMENIINYSNPVFLPLEEGAFRGLTNTRKSGSLQISKTVTGATEAADGVEFTVSVTLLDKDGDPLANLTCPTFVDGVEGPEMTTNENGVGTVTIQDGQTVVIEGLPHAATYTLEETDLPGGFTVDSTEGEEGAIVGGSQQEASFVNAYDAKGKLVLQARKIITPESSELTMGSGQFNFELKDDRGTVIGTATNDGKGTVTFDAINYTMDDIGKSFQYTVNETMVDNLVAAGEESPFATDRTIYTVVATVSDGGDGTLKVDTTIDGEEDGEILFSNTERVKVAVRKEWVGDEDKDDLRPKYIVVNLYADGEKVMSRTISAERHSTDDPNVWEYEFDNLPKYNGEEIIAYTVTENYVNGYIATIVNDGYENTITNTYTETSVPFGGSKKLVNRMSGEDMEIEEGAFHVEITCDDPKAPLPDEPVVDVGADGSFTFETLTFGLPELGVDGDGNYVDSTTYTYVIREVMPEDANENNLSMTDQIIYDATACEVNVTLILDRETSTLSAETDVKPKDVQFTNYFAAAGDVQLTAKKVLKGDTLYAKQFTFELLRDGKVLATAYNDRDGDITFPKQYFTLGDVDPETGSGEVKFVIREKYPTNPEFDLNYDTHEETVTVAITLNEDGTMTATPDKTGDQVVFENVYDDSHGVIPGYNFKFSFNKVWQGKTLGSFEWTLYRSDGTQVHKKFRQKNVSPTNWHFEAWFESDEDYYIIENVPEGYKVRYENTGKHAGETDKCYNGGTIINYYVPRTGDHAPLGLWIGCVVLGLGALGGILYTGRRKKTKK